MSTNHVLLLTTKLHSPRPDPLWVQRPRVLALFGAHSQRCLTLIVAPAGSGKTTLARQWLAAQPARFAWLSLDPTDSEPQRFFAYLVAAIQSVVPGACAATAGLVNSSQPPLLRYVVDMLLNDLAALPEPIAVVLDDFHAITSMPLHQEVVHLISYLPQTVHLVVTSRIDPPWPLGRMRANRRLLEIRATELRFTLDETRALLEQSDTAERLNTVVETLYERTEGWPAGLQLAQISLRGAADPIAFAASLRGTDRYIMDYLVDEAIALQSAPVQSFLLRTSILERFCAPLCDALLADDGALQAPSQEILATLERSNLFLIALDNQRRWFRYHHLFRDLLLFRFQAEATVDDMARLHRRASDWFDAQGLVEEAVRHAVNAGDVERAAGIVEAHFHRLFDQAPGFLTTSPLRSMLPPKVWTARPMLLVIQAYHHYGRWDFAAIARLTAQAQLLLEHDASHDDAMELEALRGDLDLLGGMVLFWTGRIDDAQERLNRALRLIPPAHQYAHCLALGHYAVARANQGDLPAALGLIDTKLAEGLDPAGAYANLLTLALVIIHLWAGNLDRMAEAARRLAAPWPLRDPYWHGAASYMLGRLHYERNELDAARTHFAQAVGSRHTINTQAVHESLAILARINLLHGNVDAAYDLARQAHSFAEEIDSQSLRVLSAALDARLASHQGAQQTTSALLPALDVDAYVGNAFFLEKPPLLRAQLLIAQATPAALSAAADLLDGCLRTAEQVHNIWQIIEIRCLQALLLRAQGDATAALVPLAAAVALAAPRGFVRTFLDGGPELAELLVQLVAQDHPQAPYLQRLLAAFAPAPFAPGLERQPSASQAGWLATQALLTAREQEILTLLAERLSDDEIATRLVISVHTVKKHTANIYGKLEVANRRQAVAKAALLGIMPLE